MEQASNIIRDNRPLKKLNDILRESNLDFSLEISENGSLNVRKTGCGTMYGISRLSDGERSAVIIIANVLISPDHALILLDEPERHLHRSIAKPLINTLLSYRQDCAFVVSTHDVSLPADNNNCRILVLKKYLHETKKFQIDYIEDISKISEIGEDVLIGILGARNKILFIEGDCDSADISLYKIIYQDITIKPLGNCQEVIRAVKGIRKIKELHRSNVFGVIDRDNRTNEECNSLILDGITPLEHYSVESIYYHPKVIRLILEENDEGELDSKMTEVENSIINAARNNRDRMASILVEKVVKGDILSQCPDWKKIQHTPSINITVDIKETLSDEKKLMDRAIEGRDIEKLISRYPFRESNALNEISKQTGFKDKDAYQQAVRSMIRKNPNAKTVVKNLLKPVTELIYKND